MKSRIKQIWLFRVKCGNESYIRLKSPLPPLLKGEIEPFPLSASMKDEVLSFILPPSSFKFGD